MACASADDRAAPVVAKEDASRVPVLKPRGLEIGDIGLNRLSEVPTEVKGRPLQARFTVARQELPPRPDIIKAAVPRVKARPQATGAPATTVPAS